MGGRAVVVKLQRDTDDVVPFGFQQRSRHRRVDATRHGDNNTGILRATFQVEAVQFGGSGHGASYYRWRPRSRNDSKLDK